MIRRIFTIILLVLLISSILLFSYILINNVNTERNIIKLKEDKEVIINNEEELTNESEELSKELNNLKETLNDNITEYEIWKETKEKLEIIIG